MPQSAYPSDPILLVDDETSWLLMASMFLRSAGLTNVATCNDSREVLERVRKQSFSLVLLDLTMPGMPGEMLLESLSREFPGLPVIVVTGADQLETGIRCMRIGAFDYFVKSSEMDRLIVSARRAISVQDLSKGNRRLRERLVKGGIQNQATFKGIITQDSRMRALFEYVEAIAPSPRPVLITGESGVGKELFARALHLSSGRPGEFVAVNSAGLDDLMCADALFGHVAGAYTGADSYRPGLVERAKGGTLFLDEIGDMTAASQAKLLRLLQEGEYTPLGSDVARRSDARVVAATHHDLWALQETGRFRRDLFYRISTHVVTVPPLRERKGDVPLLLAHFIDKASDLLGRQPPEIPDDLAELLHTYSFPGNVRELEAMVFDVVSRNDASFVPLAPFQAHVRETREPARPAAQKPVGAEDVWVAFSDPLPTLNQVADLLVKEALRRACDNQAAAAAMLGITRQALNKRVRLKHGGMDEAS